MRNSAKSRPNKSVRSNQRPIRPTERAVAEGVYANNFFMHAATSQVGTAVKLETIQGVTYEGIFKTFSQEFDVVLELAHKIDNNDPKKFDPHEVVDNLIFHAKDIVYMCAQSIELNYAMKDSFTDAGISKFNGEVSGEKKLEPWVGNDNGEECDLESTENTQNGWDVIEMFQTNKELGVGSTYDDSLADYTVQLEKKDTKDFKEEEAKATRIAMEIERNPSSQVRASFENGDNEEELFAAVVRPGSEIDGKYVPPPKRKNSQHHRSGGGGGSNSRGNYSANGNHCVSTPTSHPSFNIVINTTNTPSKVSYSSSNHSSVSVYTSSNIMPIIPPRSVIRQGSNPLPSHNTYPPRDREPRINGQIMENHAKHHNRPPPLILRGTARGNQRSYNVPESPGRQQMNNSTALSRYHHQQPQQYHQQQQAHGQHSQQPMRENSNRSSPENKNASQVCPPAVTQPQNIPAYSANMHHQQRTFAQNVVPVTNHSQNVPLQQQKSQRTSPIPVQAIPNGNADFQPKPIPTVSQQPPHQYHNQSQQTQSGPNPAHAQRKHHQHQPHHSTTRVREDQITELKKFGTDFNLSYDIKNKEAEVPKQIQVVNNRNKSPPTMQPPATERNVVTVSIVPSLPQSKHTTTTTPSAQPPMAIPSTQTPTPATHAQAMPPPANIPNQSVPTTQVGMKPHPQHVISQQATHYQAHPASMPTTQGHQQLHLQQREAQVYMQQPVTQSHPSLPQQTILPHKQQPKQSPHQVPMQSTPVQTSVPIATHVAAAASQNQKAVINSQKNVQSVHAQNVLPPNQHQSNSQMAAVQNTQSNSQACVQQRSPPQSQQNIKNAGNPSPPPSAAEHQSPDVEQAKGSSNEQDEELDDVTSALKKSTLNPNAKEFVYNPAPKSFTPVSRSPSTPTQSRPHTPQTPSYNMHSVNAAAGIQMVMPGTYVVAAQPTYVQSAPPQSSRLRKVTVGPHRTEYHPSNMQVAAATGQPLLAPSVTLAQSPLAPGQFAVQGYSPHPHLVAAASAAAAAQPYPHLQMVRMVPQQGGGVVPLVPSSISYHETSSGATAMYVNHGNAVAMAPHAQHVHHPQQHPPPSTAPSPSQTPQGPSQSHTPNSYQQPPLVTQSAPPFPPVMCPVIQAPPPHGPPHMVAPGQPHTMHQYLQHPQMGQQSHVQVSLIPYS